MQWLIALLAKIFKWDKEPVPSNPVLEDVPEPPKQPVEPSPAEKLYATAKASIGLDLTPLDEIPDEVACVAQLQAVHFKARDRHIGTGAALYNTFHLVKALEKDQGFKEVDEPRPGDLWVYATGTATFKSKIVHGHCGVVGRVQWMSNQGFGPDKGKWLPNYTKESAHAYFGIRGGYPRRLFRPV